MSAMPSRISFDPGEGGAGGDPDSIPGSVVLADVRLEGLPADEAYGGLTDDGMAFVWTSPTDATFWMKDTLIPLSIAFVGQDGR